MSRPRLQRLAFAASLCALAAAGCADDSGAELTSFEHTDLGVLADSLTGANAGADAGGAEPAAVAPGEDTGKSGGGQSADAGAAGGAAGGDAGHGPEAPPDEATDHDGDGVEDDLATATPTEAIRFGSLAVRSPPLCFSLGDDDDCWNVEAEANAAFTSLFGGGDAIIDLIGWFEGEPFGGEGSHFALAAARCERTPGAVLGCEPMATVARLPLAVGATDHACHVDGASMRADANAMAAPPCFATAPTRLDLALGDMRLVLEGAQLLATLASGDSGYAVPGGTLRGFMPEGVADQLQISISVRGRDYAVDLAELLHDKARYASRDGRAGWDLVFGFSAEPVPLRIAEEPTDEGGEAGEPR